MSIVRFNQSVFDVLTRCGFKYCYSKTVPSEHTPGHIEILLTPVPTRPNIRRLPHAYDTFFYLQEEPRQMAAGIDDDTTVFINLNDTLIKEYYEQTSANH